MPPEEPPRALHHKKIRKWDTGQGLTERLILQICIPNPRPPKQHFSNGLGAKWVQAFGASAN
jgi:hypothetical protein